MNCPVDGTQLALSERSGIEIDYCPQCRGVWLDRGELDKILEREDSYGSGPTSAPQQWNDPRYGGGHGGSHGQRRRGGLLGDLFG